MGAIADFLETIKSCTFLLLLAAFSDVSSTYTENNGASLDVAIEMITKAKYNINSDKDTQTCVVKAADCAEVLQLGRNKSGLYEIWPMNRLTEGEPLTVYCDMETVGGGWTVIQRRGDFGSPKDYFYKDWKSYKEGFGEKEKDFWLGNDNIFALTNQKLYSVRFDLMDSEKNRRYALYDTFWVDDESNNYTLYIADYRGTAGDAMTYHNNQAFSTRDRDNDRYSSGNCAVMYKGGWWYNGCIQANLNGLQHEGRHDSYADGIIWGKWKGWYESMYWTEIKIRPKLSKSTVASEVANV